MSYQDEIIDISKKLSRLIRRTIRSILVHNKKRIRFIFTCTDRWKTIKVTNKHKIKYLNLYLERYLSTHVDSVKKEINLDLYLRKNISYYPITVSELIKFYTPLVTQIEQANSYVNQKYSNIVKECDSYLDRLTFINSFILAAHY